MDKKKIIVIIFIALFSLSCATTRDAPTWVDSEHIGIPVKKIAVIGLFRNFATRQEFENEVSKKINENSATEAVPGLSFMSPGDIYEHKNMEKLFEEMGIDGILLLRTKSIDSQTVYVPGKTYTVRTTSPMYYYNYPFYHKYYITTLKTIREPGYYNETFIVCTENTLFLNSNDKMIWMMQKNTTEKYRTIDGITNPKKEAVRTADSILKDLKLNKLLLEK